MNLKAILMELGNKLVHEHGWLPGYRTLENWDSCKEEFTPTTLPITQFTEFLNNHPEAIEILEGMGVKWPVVKNER